MPFDLSKSSLTLALSYLHEQGYEYKGKFNEDYEETGTIEGSYTFLCILDDIDSDYTHKYVKECGYEMSHYSNLTDLMNNVGIIFCGGMYTAVGIYVEDTNISSEYLCNMNFIVPDGDTPNKMNLCTQYMNYQS
jgi:TPP-dependent indolepyruvate ferredoxin oxidoreductase alpha subunit